MNLLELLTGGKQESGADFIKALGSDFRKRVEYAKMTPLERCRLELDAAITNGFKIGSNIDIVTTLDRWMKNYFESLHWQPMAAPEGAIAAYQIDDGNEKFGVSWAYAKDGSLGVCITGVRGIDGDFGRFRFDEDGQCHEVDPDDEDEDEDASVDDQLLN